MSVVWLLLFIILVFLPFFILLNGPARKYWTITMAGFGVWLGGIEIYCRFFTPEQMFLTTHFSNFLLSPDGWKGWIILGCFLIGWVCLVLHLAWKVIAKKR